MIFWITYSKAPHAGFTNTILWPVDQKKTPFSLLECLVSDVQLPGKILYFSLF